MSRSGYSDDCEGWALICWRGAVNSAIRGKRGQAALRELLEALDSLPEQRLGGNSLVTAEGDYCTLGALGLKRGLDLDSIDPEDRDAVAKAFGIAEALAAEIMFENDECAASPYLWKDIEICGPMQPHYPNFGQHKRSVRLDNPHAAKARWLHMRKWVASHLKEEVR